MADHIQIGDISPRIQFTGDGAQTLFTYPFPIFKDADLAVYEDTTPKTLTTDYTVSGAGSSAGGSATFLVAPANGVIVTLKRQLAIQRTSDFQESGEFRSKVINDELDTLTASLQQVDDDVSRSLRLGATDTATSLELPAKDARTSKFLAFDANGDPIASDGPAGGAAVSTFGATLIDDADAATARTTLGLVIGSDVLSPNGDGSGLTGIASKGKNLVLNGDMRIAQEGTSFAGLVASQYTLDGHEWIDTGTTSAVVTITQNTDVPTVAEAGTKFMNSLKIDVTTAETLAGADAALYFSHKIEAQDCTQFGHGAAGALSGARSFWMKSTKTGIFTVNLDRNDGSEKYSSEHTVTTTDTWEKHTVIIPGDTDGTAIADDNGIGLTIQIMMAVGATGKTSTVDAWNTSGATELASANQVNLLDNTANNVLITGLKFEVGAVVTDFEHESFSVQLTNAQRYFAKTFPYSVIPVQNVGNYQGALGIVGASDGKLQFQWRFPVEMRANPTLVTYNPSAANSSARNNDDNTDTAVAQNGQNSSGLVLVHASLDATDASNLMYVHATVDARL